MKRQPIDQFAAGLDPVRREAVYEGSKSGHEKRTAALFSRYENPDRLRLVAGEIKQHVVENLDSYLPAAEARLKANGVQVHWAGDAESACRHVLDIMRARNATRIAKTKTMVSEEIELEAYLKRFGIETVETDLGEFIVQLAHDHPSHIVKPIMHLTRGDIGRLFEREGLGAYDDEPESITRRARRHLRGKFLGADVAITGANFLVAESGRLVVVTNEGNGRFCLAGARCHIALVGIEKILPRERDLALFLNLLARSATGQEITVYTEFVRGPKAAAQADGPEEMHVVFVDNGRTAALATDCRDILRCIRCGACLNVCPVYRQASGHAYRGVYPGPVGAVLAPLLLGPRFAEKADLPKASSLCGACNEVCPVNIPIPDLLLRLRARAKREGIPSPGTPGMGPWAALATHPAAWRAALKAGKLLDIVPLGLVPVPPLRTWLRTRTLPAWEGGAFRRWLNGRHG